jgi:hypothetical protein
MILQIAIYCLLGGLCMAIPAMGGDQFALSWVAGAILTASFVPVARHGPRSLLGQFGAIFLAAVTLAVVCTLSEAVLFVPETQAHALRILADGTATYFLLAGVLAALAKLLKLTEASTPTLQRRSVGTTFAMVLLSGFLYVVYYLIFGAIAYLFFTKQYYPQAEEQTANLGVWIWVIQLTRGVLMTLAVLPIIYTLRMRRWQAALAVGVLMWIVGGGAGLLVPNSFMVERQRYIHIVEIMTQNVSLGITAVLLLTRKRVRA